MESVDTGGGSLEGAASEVEGAELGQDESLDQGQAEAKKE